MVKVYIRKQAIGEKHIATTSDLSPFTMENPVEVLMVSMPKGGDATKHPRVVKTLAQYNDPAKDLM